MMEIVISELTEIATPLGGVAIGEARCDVLEGCLAGNDVIAKGLELRNGSFSCGALDYASFWILPRRLPSRTFVLYQYVRSPNLTANF